MKRIDQLRRIVARAILGLAIGAGATPAAAQVLVVATSDGHAHYGALPSFLANFETERRAFLARHPDGEVIVALAGDIFGSSVWTRDGDQGWVGVRAVQALASKATVVFVPGNHDGFDFASDDLGNSVAIEQFRALRQAGVHVLASNVRWAAGLEEFGPGRLDVRTARGRTVRISGFVLSDFWRSSDAHRNSRSPVFDSVVPVDLQLEQESILAAQDRVDVFLPVIHESFARTQRNLTAHNAGRSRTAANSPSIPLVIAAHDHLTRNREVQRSRTGALSRPSRVIDAGFGFNSWVAVLDESRGEIESLFFRPASVLPRGAQIPVEAEEARAVADRVRAIPGFRSALPPGLRPSQGADPTEAQSSALAIGMADVIARAGAHLAPDASLAIGFYGNPGFDVSPGEMSSLHAFGHLATAVARRRAGIRVFLVSRLVVSRLYRALLANESPTRWTQVTSSSNIRESSLNGPIEVLGDDGVWGPLPMGEIAVAVDSYVLRWARESHWRDAFGTTRPVAEQELVDAVLAHGPEAFRAHRDVRSRGLREDRRASACSAFFATPSNF